MPTEDTGRKARMPAFVERTKSRQLSVSLSDDEAQRLEGYRRLHGLRSWGEAVRHMIATAKGRR